MMHVFCVRYGYCGSVVNGEPRHIRDYIPETGLVTAEDFVWWLIEAEGLDPAPNTPENRRRNAEFKEIFIQHMGSDEVDASLLRYA